MGNLANLAVRRAHRRLGPVSSVRSANVGSPPGPSHANPSPRAVGAPLHVGLGSPGQSALPPPQRIAGSYASFQPPGGLARGLTSGVPRHHGTVVPPALPHDRRVWNVGPGQTHLVAKAGNFPFVSLRGWLENPVYSSLAGRYTFAIPARVYTSGGLSW